MLQKAVAAVDFLQDQGSTYQQSVTSGFMTVIVELTPAFLKDITGEDKKI